MQTQNDNTAIFIHSEAVNGWGYLMEWLLHQELKNGIRPDLCIKTIKDAKSEGYLEFYQINENTFNQLSYVIFNGDLHILPNKWNDCSNLCDMQIKED